MVRCVCSLSPLWKWYLLTLPCVCVPFWTLRTQSLGQNVQLVMSGFLRAQVRNQMCSFICLFLVIHYPLREIWVSLSTCMSSATNIYWSMQHFGVSRQWCGCHCVEFLMSTQMLKHQNSTLGKKYIKSAVSRVDFFVGVGRVIDKPCVILTQVQVPGAARTFLSEPAFSADSYGVSTAPMCNHMHQHPGVRKKSQTLAVILLFGPTKNTTHTDRNG